MDVAAFHVWTLKLAVQILNSLSAAQRDTVVGKNPVMLIPEDLASHLRGLILDCMSTNEFRSRQIGQRSGQFWFEMPVKYSSVKRAAF